jgi:hypothetical protein
MSVKPVTYTIPVKLDAALRSKVGRGRMSRFVTQALWEALRRDEEVLLKEFLEADKEAGNIEVQQSFSEIEGEDFIGFENEDFRK